MNPEEINKKAKEAFPDGVQEEVRDTDMLRCGYERALEEISALPTIKGWVARDKDGALIIYDSVPQRIEDMEIWNNETSVYCASLPKDMLPTLRWEDEPIEVELPIIQK